MVGEIRNGDLFVIRNCKWEYKVMYCPFQEDMVACGDWCPKFDVQGDGNRYAVILNCGTANEIILASNPWETSTDDVISNEDN